VLGVSREDEPRFGVWSTAFIDPGDPATGDFATRRRRREQTTAEMGRSMGELADARVTTLATTCCPGWSTTTTQLLLALLKDPFA
jgi:hypothetical protein